jgi:hypothetical protein
VAYVDDAVVDPFPKRREENAFETPVGYIRQRFSLGRGMGQKEAEEILRIQKGLNLAIGAGKEMIRFFQNNRGPALRALVVDEEFRGLQHGPRMIVSAPFSYSFSPQWLQYVESGRFSLVHFAQTLPGGFSSVERPQREQNFAFGVRFFPQ